jgi:hypothetical protein
MGSDEPSRTLVEWASKAAFESYRNDPEIADVHQHREKGARDYIWHLFDKLEDLRPILRQPRALMHRAPPGARNDPPSWRTSACVSRRVREKFRAKPKGAEDDREVDSERRLQRWIG